MTSLHPRSYTNFLRITNLRKARKIKSENLYFHESTFSSFFIYKNYYKMMMMMKIPFKSRKEHTTLHNRKKGENKFNILI